MLRPLCFLLLAFPIFAAPKPLKAPLEPYAPTIVGTHLVYERVLPQRDSDHPTNDHVVDKVESNDGTLRVSVSVSIDADSEIRVFELSSKGVELILDPDKKDSKRVRFLKLPAKVGDEWTTEESTYFAAGKSTVVALDEEVTVPGGKFSCIRIEQEPIKDESECERQIYWYARGVGMVKCMVIFSSHDSYEVRLKSFKPGK